MVSSVQLKLLQIPWRKKFRASGGKPLQSYAKSVIINSFRDEIHTILCRGFRGLSYSSRGHANVEDRVNRPKDDLPSRQSLEILEKMGKDGMENVLVVRDLMSRLDPLERRAIELLYAFDYGPSRNIIKVAQEMGIPRKNAQTLIDSGMKKLR